LKVKDNLKEERKRKYKIQIMEMAKIWVILRTKIILIKEILIRKEVINEKAVNLVVDKLLKNGRNAKNNNL
jgi:hypothetical protein